MKRKLSIVVSVFFLLTVTSVLLSPPGNAFWYGDQLPGFVFPIGPMETNYQDLNDLLHMENGILAALIVNSFFGTPPYPGEGLITYTPEKCWNGYTLLSSFGGMPGPNANLEDPANDDPENWYYAILIDMEGNFVKGWSGNPFPAKMLPNGYVLMAKGLQEELYQSPRFVQMDWCGNVVWEWESMEAWPCSNEESVRCNDGLAYTGQHHDWQREGNPVGYYAPGMNPLTYYGKTLILSSTVPPHDDTADISNYRLISDALYEVGWNQEILWQWHDHEHFDEADCGGRPGCLDMGFDEVEKAGIMEYRAFITNDENASDYHHTNSASYLGVNKWYSYYGDERFHPDNIIWDGRQSNIIAIVARHDHPDGVTWKSGDIVWRVGPDYGPAHPEGRLGQIIGQHHAHMIPYGLPGAGNILVFDNGGMAGWGPFLPGMPQPVGYAPIPAPFNAFFGNELHIGSKFRNYSRVIEFNPINMEVIWEYKSLAPNNAYGRNMYSGFISGAQRLYNGNTLITEGQPGRVFEVTKQGEVVWEYINPYNSGPAVGPGAGANSVYRAYRIPAHWVPVRHQCR